MKSYLLLLKRVFPLFIGLLLSLIFATSVKSQSCFNTGINGQSVSVNCSPGCTTLFYQIPHLKQTSNYILSTIPYTPYQYIVASGGTEDPLLYADDQYGAAFTLPFSFCFYTRQFSHPVMGSNGLLTFDSTNASCANSYIITPPIPGNGGGGNVACSQFSAYYPKAAVMPIYADHYPVAGYCPADFKIQWRVEGTAPCRRFIVSWYHIGIFLDQACGLATPSTFQAVMYESTGIIEFYYENYTCTSTTNTGNGILGIQNFARSLAVFETGKNPGVFTLKNTARRLLPSGGASRFVSSQLFTLSGTFVENADTATTTAGLLDLSFPSFCPPAFPAKYVIVTTFAGCPGGNITSSDTVTINCVLPVNLVSFTGKTIGHHSLLQWQTATEENTNHFVVEYSSDGINYSSIGTVAAAGNSTTKRNYSLIHSTPRQGSSNYYRLKTVDNDNRQSYSSIVRLAITNAQDITIYPNPAMDFVTVEYPISDVAAEIKLFDMSGRLLLVNKADINTSQANIKVSNLPRGSYKVMWSDGINKVTKTLLLK